MEESPLDRARRRSDETFTEWQRVKEEGGDVEAAYAAWRSASADFMDTLMTDLYIDDATEIFGEFVNDWRDQIQKPKD